VTKRVSEMTEEELKHHKALQRARRLKKQIAIHEIYNYTCQVCGLKEETLGFFEFHHIDPTTKHREIGSMLNSASLETIKKELVKCLMLCPNCHKKEHLKVGMTTTEIRRNKQ
jgi:predicted HNH restriction endonuclease